ncbi:leucine-rich repeat protein [Paenibacillus thermotolerans]|uniref:leucine-rich repeat protein n=1 Tax=Paenibacillus thermotolerans TaxID=3027807 RepID=UPI002367884E|nr:MULTISPECIES: leucine-rich repeat protein [unclassified Paenibacillus]
MRRVLLFMFAIIFFGSGLSFPEVHANSVQESDFIYLESETEIIIMGYVGTSKDVTIPSSIAGKPVTYITGLNDKQLTSVTIPDSVTFIGGSAFANNALTEITIPSSVTHIDSFAFYRNQLMSVEIPDSVEYIGRAAFQTNRLQRATLGNVSEIGAYAFSDNQLEEIAIPGNVKEIAENTFEKNKLRSVTFQGPITHIRPYAFAENELTTVALPATLKYLGANAFKLNRIQSIAIPPNFEFGGDVFSDTNVTMYFAKWGSTPHLNYMNQYGVRTWPCEYRIRYDGNGSAGGTPPSDTNYVCYRNHGSVPDQGSLLKTGHVFKGWNTEPDGTGNNYFGGQYPIIYGIAADSFTLYANWERETYRVAFDTGGGTNISDQTVAYGQLAIEPPAPLRVNYDFEGWYTDSGYTRRPWDFANDTVLETMTLYAKWKWSGAEIASVQLTPGSPTATGGDTLSVTGLVTDADGSPVPNAVVNLESSLGTWNASSGGRVSVATGADGTFLAAWTAPFVEDSTYVTLTASVDGTDIAPSDRSIQVVPSERSDARLIGLSLNEGTLNPVFSAEALDYVSEDVGNGVTSVAVTAEAANGQAAITINGIPADSGSAVNVPLRTGANVIPIVVTAGDGIHTRTYTISVSRAYETTSGDYVYFLNDVSGGITIRSYIGSETNVVIPDTLGGHIVTEIGTGAFMNKQLTAVSIPETVTSIGPNAFSGNALTEVTIPEGVTAIHRAAFMNNRLTRLSVPSSVTLLDAYSFHNNLLEELTFVGDGLKEIGDNAFSSNRLSSVILPRTLTLIDRQAFYNNDLTRVILPANVRLNSEAFGGTQNRVTMVFPPDTDLLMYAINNFHNYTESYYRVVYDGNGQTGGKAPEDYVRYHYYSSTPIQSHGGLTKFGHSFAGWNTEPDGSGQTYAAGESYELQRINGDLTLYAVWEATRFTVSYHTGGGTVLPETTAAEGALLPEPPTPAKEGHRFVGWYQDPDYTVVWNFAEDRVAGNMSLFAKWERKPLSIRLSVASPTASSGEEMTVTGIVYDEDGTPAADVTVKVSSTLGGRWNEAGAGEATLTSDSAGAFAASWTAPHVSDSVTGTISATVDGDNGASASVEMKVIPVPSSNAELADLTISPGELTPEFDAGVTDYRVSVEYATSSVSVVPLRADPSATVTVNGNVVTYADPIPVSLDVGPNAVTLIVTAPSGFTRTYTVTVTRAPEQAPNVGVEHISVTAENDADSVAVGGTLRMIASVLPDNATDPSVRWEIAGGTGQADIDADTGMLTGRRPGTVTVIANTQDGTGVIGSKIIEVIPAPVAVVPVSSITVTGAAEYVFVGGTLQMNASVSPDDATNKQVAWTVEAGTGETAISATGVLTGIKAGTVSVKATSTDGTQISSAVNITVRIKPVTGIVVSSADHVTSLYSGEQVRFRATVIPEDAGDRTVTWSVRNGTGTAVINADGWLTAGNAGTVTVVATANDGSGVAGSQVVTIYRRSGSGGSGGGGVSPEAPKPPATPPAPVPESTPALPAPPAPAPEPIPALPAAPLPVIDVVPGRPAVDVNDPKYIEVMKETITEKLRASRNTSTSAFLDAENHWAADSIRLFAKLGIVQGYGNGTFQPNKSVTRGEFAMMVTKLFPFAKGSQATVNFSDLEDSWAKDAVLTLAGNGLIFGYEDGSFRADKNITRAEMVAVIARIVNLNDVKRAGTAGFQDIDHTWGKAEIQQASEAGIVSGLDANTFAPEKNATRAEALTVLLRTIKLSPEIEALLDSLE